MIYIAWWILLGLLPAFLLMTMAGENLKSENDNHSVTNVQVMTTCAMLGPIALGIIIVLTIIEFSKGDK